MKHLRFDTFRVTAGNRDAHALCRAVAAGEISEGGPFLLLGPHGSGKSHLLWSVVNAVRSGGGARGIALIMPREFPEKVKDLLADPSPIEGEREAVLLVDELDGFTEEVDTLERVVELFVELRHPVVLASATHYNRLHELSRPFRALLAEGETLTVALAPDAAAGLLASHPEPQRLLETQREEIAALRRQLERSRKGHADTPGADLGAEEWRVQYERTREERDRLEAALADKAPLTAEVTRLRTEAAEARAEAAEARVMQARLEEALARAEAETADRTAAAWSELETRLRDTEAALNAAAAERDALEVRLAERAALQSELGAARAETAEAKEAAESAAAELASIREELTAAARERAEAEETLQRAREECVRLRGELRTARTEAEEAYAEHARLQGQASQKKRLEEEAEALLAELRAEMPREEARMEALHAQLRAAAESLEALAATWKPAGGGAEDHAGALTAIEGERDTLAARLRQAEIALETSRRSQSLQTAEMDALRAAAARQAAIASVQAGELEHYVARLESALDITRHTGRMTSGALQRAVDGLNGTRAGLQDALMQLGKLEQLDAGARPRTAEPEAQRDFFDAVPAHAEGIVELPGMEIPLEFAPGDPWHAADETPGEESRHD